LWIIAQNTFAIPKKKSQNKKTKVKSKIKFRPNFLAFSWRAWFRAWLLIDPLTIALLCRLLWLWLCPV
tara:strand:+ start:1867 stop:2070 length:204 start_codon:yes stop_codon:yes gene_type:complete